MDEAQFSRALLSDESVFFRGPFGRVLARALTSKERSFLLLLLLLLREKRQLYFEAFSPHQKFKKV